MVKLTRDVTAALRQHAEEIYPEECCGVLLGGALVDVRTVVEVRPCANVRAGTRDRYAIAPEELIAAQREARERGLSILGFYHSHPDHPAEPSATDTAEAFWVGSLYVIISVVKGRAEETAAYSLAEAAGRRRLVPEPIEIV